MPEVEAPFTGTSVDTSDPVGSLKSLAFGILGVGVLVMVMNYGGIVGNRLTDFTDSLLGTDASGNNIFTRGEL